MNTHVVIMAGGIGSRLWPLSTPDVPKQFIDILGVGRSLIQLTVDRFASICAPENFWVVTGEKYVNLVHNQLPQIPVDQILAEPEGRNTAPCIAYASWKIQRKDPEANIVVTPADALVLKTAEFAETIGKALAFTQERDAIVTGGIAPTRPETGYGYIHAAEALRGQIVKVSEFKEKPDLDTAIGYLEDGHYFWNAGIFVWNVNTIVEELRSYAPQIAAVMDVYESVRVAEDARETIARFHEKALAAASRASVTACFLWSVMAVTNGTPFFSSRCSAGTHSDMVLPEPARGLTMKYQVLFISDIPRI